MPKNLFGKLKPDLLMQQGPIQMPPQQYFTPQEQPPSQPPTPPMMSRPLSPRSPKGTDEEFKALVDFVGSGVKSYQSGVDERMSGVPSAPPEDARKIMFGSKEGPMHEGPPEGYGERKSALDQYIADQFSANPGAEGPSLMGKFDISKLGAAAADMEKSKLARRQEFESTPELDKLIASTQGQLDQAKSERKKPGLGEFLTLALMNLGNRDYQNNASMVLGTGEQKERESKLENLLNHLQGSKASAQMQGRREMHSTDQQNRARDLQTAMKNAEMKQKQSNFDQKLEFDKNQAGVNLLRQLSGQDAQIEGQTMDTKTREAAAKRRAKLLQTLGPMFGGDSGGMEKLTAPKDNRQSRLFGDFIGGGGYA